ncbi:hypothetical protein D3C81_1149200 [compost metagenome]
MAREPLAQVGVEVDLTRGGNAAYRQVLHHNMRRQHGDAVQRLREAGGIDQRNRAPVAVAQQPGHAMRAARPDIERVEQCRQRLARLAVHEVGAPLLGMRARRGAAVAIAREHQSAIVAGLAEIAREIAPHADRAQPFVQEDHQRPLHALGPQPLVFDLDTAFVEGDFHQAGRHRHLVVWHRFRKLSGTGARLPRAGAAGTAGSCRWRSWAVPARIRSGAGTCTAPAAP